MTRQQLGDEAIKAAKDRVLAVQPNWYEGVSGTIYCPILDAKGVWIGWKRKAKSWIEAACNLYGPVPPEYETFDWKRIEDVAADDLCTSEEHPDHEACVACTAIKGTRRALQMRTKLEALEFERGALKAEVKRLTEYLAKSNAGFEEYERKFYLQQDLTEAADARIVALHAELDAMAKDRNLWQEAHNEDCPNKAQLDAVVGQETPQAAWERGQKVMALKFAVLPSGPLRKSITTDPYMPPLKAGQ